MRLRLGPLIFLAALLPALALFSGAKCYPPNTRVVVFLQGLYSSYDANGPTSIGIEPHTFDTLKQAFVAKGYAPSRLIDYSYAGGSVANDGAWQPQQYDCEITDRLPDESLAVLERMLRDYRQKHRDAHFTLVGHSVGGYLAFLEGVRESARSDSDKLAIDSIVTLDAPLKGVSADKKIVIDNATSCPKTYIAGGDLVRVRADPNTPTLRDQQTAAVAAQGLRVATLGNTTDCLFNLPLCLGSGVDDTPSEFIATAAFSRAYEIHINPFLSHHAILIDASAIADAVTFVGAP